jgi:hypothetical protein
MTEQTEHDVDIVQIRFKRMPDHITSSGMKQKVYRVRVVMNVDGKRMVAVRFGTSPGACVTAVHALAEAYGQDFEKFAPEVQTVGTPLGPEPPF